MGKTFHFLRISLLVRENDLVDCQFEIEINQNHRKLFALLRCARLHYYGVPNNYCFGFCKIIVILHIVFLDTIMFSLIRTYRRLLHEKPFVTNVCTTCTFMISGDLTSQCFFQNKDHIELKQTLRFAIAGLIFVGPLVRGSLVMIDKIFGPTASVKILAKKLVLDQGIIAPCFLVGNISTLTFLKTRSLQSIKQELEDSYFKLLKLNYSFWPFVQVINFYFIPLTYRVLFGSTAALAWNTMFSYNLHSKQKQTTLESS